MLGVLAGCGAGLAWLDEGRPTSAGVNAVAGRAVAFLVDLNPAATFLVRAGEHGPLGVLRHPDLPRPSLVCVGQHVTPGDNFEQHAVIYEVVGNRGWEFSDYSYNTSGRYGGVVAVMLFSRRRWVQIPAVVLAAGLSAGDCAADHTDDVSFTGTVHDGPALALTDAITVDSGKVHAGVLEITGLWNSAVQHLQTLLPGSTIL